MEGNSSEAETETPVKLDRIDQPGARILGSAAGLIRYSDDWDAPISNQDFDEFLGSSR